MVAGLNPEYIYFGSLATQSFCDQKGILRFVMIVKACHNANKQMQTAQNRMRLCNASQVWTCHQYLSP